MIKYNLLKSIFLSLAIQFLVAQTQAQSWGSIKLETYATQLSHQYGMSDYENYYHGSPHTRPDVYYFLKNMHIYNHKGPWITSGGYTLEKFFMNETTRFHNIGYHPVINKTLYAYNLNGNSFVNLNNYKFDLRNKKSLRIYMKYSANEDDYGMSPPVNGDDDYRFSDEMKDKSFLDFAKTGDYYSNHLVRGDDTYDYYFKFYSRYTIDAIEPQLTYLNMKGQPQTIFCKGEQMKVKATHKKPFTNGYFRWERSDGNGWYHIGNGGNVITQTVNSPVVYYRARLIGDANNYGVRAFYSDLVGSAYTVNNSLTVINKVDEIVMDIKDACPDDGIGSVEVTYLYGAQVGDNYTVIFYTYDSTDARYEIEEEKSITNYHPDSLSTYDLLFYAPVGKYKVGIFNNAITGELPCGITRGLNIIESTNPVFTASKRDVLCHGHDGKIFFKDLQQISNNKFFTIQATSATDSVFSKKIYTQNGFLNVPFGVYTLKAINDDGCVFDYVGTIEILDIPPIIASVAPLTGYEVDGITYHGTCAYDRFDATVTIGGGLPPYTISTVGPFSNYNQTFTLLENETEITIPELFPGSHLFYISDKNGCTIAALPFEINNPNPIQFPTFDITHPTGVCGGILPNGIIAESGEVSGGFPPYQYFFDGVEVNSFDSTGLGNMSARLVIKDSIGCEAVKYVMVENNTFLMVQDNGELPIIIPCGGSIEYQIEVNGGTPDLYEGYFFKLNGVFCEDNPNCQSNTTFFYAGQPAYYTITVDNEDEQYIEVSDHSPTGCTVSITHQFDQVQPLEITGASAVPPSCSDGIYHSTFYVKNLPLSPYGGYEGFQYELDGVGGYPTLVMIDGTSDPIIPLQFTVPVSGTGLHQILITDDFGCGTGIPYEFSLAPVGAFNFSLTSSEDLICHNDTTGAFSFNLDGDSPYAVEIFKDGSRIDSITLNTDDYRLNHLLSGTYVVQVTDYKGCKDTSNNIIITNPAPIQAMVNSASAINCTGENGVVEVSNISGGTAPYNFSLNGQPFQITTTLDGGFEENNILIKDTDNCYAELSLTIPLAGPTLFSTTTALVPESECGLGKTIIQLQPGFTFPLEIDFIADPNDYISSDIVNFGDSLATEIYLDTISDLSAGVYYFLVKDGLGCELVDSFTVGTAAPLFASITSVTEETCHRQSKDGKITINASGGAPPYMMTLQGEEVIMGTDTMVITDTITFTNSYTIDSLSIGVYSYTVEDSQGCMYNLTDSIQAGSLPLLNYVVSDYAGCALENLTAKVEIHAYNGNGNYTYQWEHDGSTDSIRLDITPDDYNVIITDAIGCTSIGIAYVYNLDSLNVTVDSIINVICQADSTGQITLTTSGGFSPYQFSIDDGNTYQVDSIFTDLGIGTYEFFVKDNHDCLDTTSATITFTNSLIATVSTTNETCTASDDGTLKITVGGGIAPFTYSLNNIDFQPQNEFTGLIADTYSAWVQDGSGCKAVYHNNIITEPAILNLSTSLVADEACNQVNGSASGSASGGTPPYIYEWDGNMNLDNSLLENAAAGVHTLKVTDANLCTQTSMVTIGFINAPTLFLENSQSEICGNANGSIDLKITNGVAPYSFSWSHDGMLNDSLATNLAAGNYSVTISDANMCTNILSVVVNEIAGPTPTVFFKTNSICTDDNGTIVLQLTNGISPFTYTWSHDNMLNNNTATNLSAGTYSATVTDTNGCQDVISTSIIFEESPTISVASFTNTDCLNSVGDITVQVVNGLSPYIYAWSHDANLNNPSATGLTTGNYFVTVSDANGCTDIISQTLGALPPPTLSLENIQSETCGNTNGLIDLKITNGVAPFTFSWNHNASLNDSLATNLVAGNYSVTVTDVNMCTDILNISINEIAAPSLVLENSESEKCGMSNGSIDLKIENGVAPFTFQWSHDGILNDSLATSLPAGNYSVTVSDANACTNIFSTTINEIAGPTLSVFSKTNSTCIDDNGTIALQLANGTAPFIYTWSHDNMLNNNTATNLPAGNYSATITDVNGCQDILSTTIDFVNGPTVSLENSQSEICGNVNGSIDLKITNGTSPYSFQWSPNGISGDSLITNLAAGSYFVTVTDANGCQDLLSTTIGFVNGPTVSLENSQPEICGNTNGTIDLKITNGTSPYSFQWSHNASLNDSLATNLAAGNYSVTVSDANACTDILSISINEIAGSSLVLENSQPEICGNANGTIDLKITNGAAPFSFLWSHDATLNDSLVTNLAAGNYVVTVTDANGCTGFLNISINEILGPTLSIFSKTNSICTDDNGEIILTTANGTAPFTYVWAHNATLNNNTITNLSAGNYSATITDANGCSDVISTSIDFEESPILSIASFNNTDCLNSMGDISVQVMGGLSPFTYEWSHDANVTGTTATGLNSGNYTITVTDANGCKSIVTQSLIEFEGDISITNSLECSYDSDGSLLVTLQGNPADYNYEWSDATIPDSHIASNLSGGIYTVTITNSNGCTQDFSINLNAPNEILSNISNVIPVGCGGNLGSATATPSGGTGNYTYNWNDPNGQITPTANNLPVGNYSILIIDDNGCTAFENVEIIQSSEIILVQGTISNPLCNGEENGSTEVMAIQGFPPYNYLWSNGQTTPIASNLGGGDYTVTVTDAVGCTKVTTSTIDEPMPFTTDEILIQEPFCFEGNEGEVTVSVSGGTTPYQYQWDDNLTQTTDTATNLIAGNYNVTITDFNSCSVITEVEVTQPTALQVTNSILQIPTCVGDADGIIEVAVEGGTLDYQYNWNGGGATNNNTFTNIENGIHVVEITDNNGCSISEIFELEDPDSILLVTEILTPISCEGTPNGEIEILAEGGDQNLTYSWSNGKSGNIIENLSAANYEVSITDGLGCEVIENFEIESIDIAPLNLGESDTMLCNNGVLFYDFSNTDYVEFSWGNLTEGELSNAAEFTTFGEDVYYLHALRNDGCLVKDSIRVNFTNGNLDAFFIAPTDIVVGDTIVALELTLPIPDGVLWEYDENNIELVEQRDNQYLFYFSGVGEYDLKLISTLGGCQSDISKTIFVYADSTQIPFINATVPTITELNLFPNPNDGVFTINVELANVNDMVIDIFNEQSMLVDRNIFTGKDIYSKNYELNLPTGIYYVIVQVAGARRSLTFVID